MKTRIMALVGLCILFMGGVFALTWSNYGSDLANGTFNDTLYNASGEYVHLNYTDATNTTYVWDGTYISDVQDLGDTTTFLTLEWEGKIETCPGNMSYIDKLGGFCIDKYESSMPNANSTDMGNATEIANRNNPGTMPATSKPGVVPWVEISRDNARIACSNAGKHLCTSQEWLAAANLRGQIYNLPTTLSVAPYYCVVDSSTYCLDHSYGSGEACNTGSKSGCVSSEGVYDMVGNVWEWVNDTVTTICPGASTNWYYPSDSGWQTSTGSATLKYGNDGVYFPSGTSSGRAVLRGGYWSNGADAGPFAVHLYYDPSDVNYNLGFRCCSVP